MTDAYRRRVSSGDGTSLEHRPDPRPWGAGARREGER